MIKHCCCCCCCYGHVSTFFRSELMVADETLSQKLKQKNWESCRGEKKQWTYFSFYQVKRAIRSTKRKTLCICCLNWFTSPKSWSVNTPWGNGKSKTWVWIFRDEAAAHICGAQRSLKSMNSAFEGTILRCSPPSLSSLSSHTRLDSC